MGRARFEHTSFLDAARTLASEHGPAAVTVESVTQHLGPQSARSIIGSPRAMCCWLSCG